MKFTRKKRRVLRVSLITSHRPLFLSRRTLCQQQQSTKSPPTLPLSHLVENLDRVRPDARFLRWLPARRARVSASRWLNKKRKKKENKQNAPSKSRSKTRAACSLVLFCLYFCYHPCATLHKSDCRFTGRVLRCFLHRVTRTCFYLPVFLFNCDTVQFLQYELMAEIFGF